MATAILRYMSDIRAPPAEKEVTLVSGKYTFTSDDLPVISCDGYTFAIAATACANGRNVEQYLTELFQGEAGTVVLPW